MPKWPLAVFGLFVFAWFYFVANDDEDDFVTVRCPVQVVSGRHTLDCPKDIVLVNDYAYVTGRRIE